MVTFLTEYIDKQGPTLSVKVMSITQTEVAEEQCCHGTFKGKIELKNSQEVYDLILLAQQQQLYELQYKAHF